MTGIIYDGKVIAADQLFVERNFTIQKYDTKIAKWAKGIVATSGTVSDEIVFTEWLNAGRQTKSPSVANSFEALFTEDGEIYWCNSDLVPIPATVPTGIGSSGEILEILCRGGLSAEKALKAAMKWRIDIGGKIDVVKVNE